MNTALLRGERGQALVVVAIAAVVLVAALALAVDWGYGVAQRRVSQNVAEAAALAAGKLVAGNYQADGTFRVSQEEAWCAARHYQDANAFLRPAAATTTLAVAFSADGVTWTLPVTSARCPPGPGTRVPSGTVYVRVRTETTYATLAAAVVGTPSLAAGASARVRITGSPGPRGPVWPLLRHYDLAEYSTACGTGCNPTTVEPVTFWTASGGSAQVYGNFQMLVDLSRYSARYGASWLTPSQVSQLLHEWDGTGSVFASPPTTPKPDTSGACGRDWDTMGSEDPAQQNARCSLPNFLDYGFGGNSSLDRDWPAALPAGQEAPPTLPTRTICGGPSWLRAPSCLNPSVGDWLETTFRSIGEVVARLSAYVERYGETTAYSDYVVPSGPNSGNRYGKAVAFNVYVWDCAERFYPLGAREPGNQWDLVPPTTGNDCSRLATGAAATTPDRVHVFSVIPFTFYQGLLTTQGVQGYWGGGVERPGRCRSNPGNCPLNPISNSVFLVPDD